MLKKLLIILLAIVLLASPLVVRWLYFYESRYQPGQVPRPDLAQIEAPLPETQPFQDRQVTAALGTVLVDLAHSNRVEMSELNVLQARLSARGQRLEPITDAADLARQLRYGQALIIVSPGQDWLPDEIRQVQDFVTKGGRLLLVTDPTRFDVIYDEYGNFVELDYDAPHLNDLAARFGLLFQTDYLYNTVDNAGNFRNIRLTDVASHQLTQGVDQLVFFAAHSIVSQEPALILAGGETRSSTSERDTELAVGLLVADDAVLALGDLTFMTEPQNAVEDNDQFVANIADFLGGGRRQYALADFPFFFGEQVDLIYADDPLLDSSLLETGSTLQALLDKEGRTLTVRSTEDKAHDTLFLGLYEQAQEVEPYLTAAQVTLLITPTQEIDAQKPAQSTLTTSPITPTKPTTATVTSQPKSPPESETPAGSKATQSAKNKIVIEPLGEMALAGTTMLLRQTDGGREVMVVLAETEKGLQNAIQRLTTGSLANCLLQEGEGTTVSLLALCPTGITSPEDKGGGWQEPVPGEPAPPAEPAEPSEPEPIEPPAEPSGRLLIIALDHVKGRYDSLTSIKDFVAILQDRFTIKTWSAAEDGPPDQLDLSEFDLVILTAGDFEDALDAEYTDLLFSLMLDGTPVILSGAYISENDAKAVQRDIQVSDSTHPLAKGFGPDEVIEFVSAPSGQEYEIAILEDIGEDEGSTVFVRGPGSEENGAASIVTLEDEFDEFRVVVIGLPLYLLPEPEKVRLVLNAVSWLVGP